MYMYVSVCMYLVIRTFLLSIADQHNISQRGHLSQQNSISFMG